jgi:hypothetical protein
MRPTTLFGGLAVAALFGLAQAVHADPYDAVIEKETDARCGRGDSAMFYPTNHLKPGDRVRVLKEEEGGWLAILPPSGSFSWINKQLLSRPANWPANTWTVSAAEAPVRVGSYISQSPPTVIGITLKTGAIVTGIANGVAHVDQEGTWLPIDPPQGEYPHCEVRYIRADVIHKPAPGAANTGGLLTAAPGANAAPGDADALYKQAVAAEKWNPQQAITLYEQAANSDANPDRRLQILNRANWLRENLKNPTPTLVPGVAPGNDLRMAAAPSESKVYPTAGDPSPNTNVRLAPPQGSAAPVGNGWSATPVALNTSPSATPGAPAGPPAAGTEYSSGPGWLQVSARTAEGKKTYVMVSDRGAPFYYVTGQQGVNLEPYLKRRVELFGQAIYSGDLRANYMRVARIEMREGQ